MVIKFSQLSYIFDEQLLYKFITIVNYLIRSCYRNYMLIRDFREPVEHS